MKNIPLPPKMLENKTMSLREIAKVLNVRNDNIVQSAETLQEQGVIVLKTSPFGTGGKIDQVLNRIDSITLVAQNNPRLIKAIVIRWDELESRQIYIPLPPKTPLELLNDAVAVANKLHSEKEALHAQLAQCWKYLLTGDS
jgi:phage regulator Rha-like protein